MKSELLSARQIWVAVLVGGLSTAAAGAGLADWRWLLAAGAIGVAAGWLLLLRVGRGRLHPVLEVAYRAWAVLLMADVLRRAALRVQQASGEGGGPGWLLVLLALPLIWMGLGKTAAFFRAVEIFWLAMLAVTAVILLLGLPRMDWRWAMQPVGSWQGSLLAGALTMSTGLFVLPYLYKVKAGPERPGHGLVWLGALGLLSAALSLLTTGLLSPGVAVLLEGPFFAAAGLLGESARLEGLISAVWLLPDLTLAGLLARGWGDGYWPGAAVLVALGVALTGATQALPQAVMPAGCLVLAVLTMVLPPKEKG